MLTSELVQSRFELLGELLYMSTMKLWLKSEIMPLQMCGFSEEVFRLLVLFACL